MTALNVPEVSEAILSYWFSSLDDAAALDREAEPFASSYARWYGKRPEIDAEIRARFEPVLHAVTRDGARWDRQVDAWRSVPQGLVALVILLDQFPRNMYRDTPGMYVHDPLALMVATLATREYAEASLSLVRWMFVYLPFMHAENLTVQQAMVRRFERLADLAVTRSHHNVKFFEFVVRGARRHLDVVEEFGRFPHRNEILGRRSTPDELAFLEREDSRF